MIEDDKPLTTPAPLVWRLPIIRHVRAIVLACRLASWEQNWSSFGYVPQSFDRRVLRQIWRGIV